MNKQTIKAVVSSRRFQYFWCGFFMVLGAAIGLRATSPVTAAFAWWLCGFQAAMLAMTVMRSAMLRSDFRAIDKREQQAIRNIARAEAGMREVITQIAAEHGMELTLEKRRTAPQVRH